MLISCLKILEWRKSLDNKYRGEFNYFSIKLINSSFSCFFLCTSSNCFCDILMHSFLIGLRCFPLFYSWDSIMTRDGNHLHFKSSAWLYHILFDFPSSNPLLIQNVWIYYILISSQHNEFPLHLILVQGPDHNYQPLDLTWSPDLCNLSIVLYTSYFGDVTLNESTI